MNWLGLPHDHPFSVANLPYATAVIDGRPHTVVRAGDHALDVTAATAGGERAGLFAEGTLDVFLAAGRRTWMAVRAEITDWLTDSTHRRRIEPLLIPVDELDLQLPFTVADYVDFYASEAHATNVGRIFRPDTAPLTPNWKHLPIGYHGRAGTVVVSGTAITRPTGQSRDPDGGIRFGPSRRLDIEAEMGFVVGTPTALGTPVPVDRFREHVFGLCLLNDWSARDIQAWESVPLGPFLGKSFGTTVSAWITPLDALEHAWTNPPPREQAPAGYLDDSATPCGLDITVEIRVNGSVVSRPPFATMYWTPAQMLAHMTVNGASLRTGDLYASGTISGRERDQRGSLLELTWNGTEPLTLDDRSSRGFLEDGDEVVLTATAPGRDEPLALGEARGRIRAARD